MDHELSILIYGSSDPVKGIGTIEETDPIGTFIREQALEFGKTSAAISDDERKLILGDLPFAGYEFKKASDGITGDWSSQIGSANSEGRPLRKAIEQIDSRAKAVPSQHADGVFQESDPDNGDVWTLTYRDGVLVRQEVCGRDGSEMAFGEDGLQIERFDPVAAA